MYRNVGDADGNGDGAKLYTGFCKQTVENNIIYRGLETVAVAPRLP